MANNRRFPAWEPPCNIAARIRAAERVEPSYASEVCIYCGVATKMTVDHVEPLTRGGEHVTSNTVWSCWRCNHSKGNKFLLEWVVCGLSPFTAYGGEERALRRPFAATWPRVRVLRVEGDVEVLACGHRRAPRLIRRQFLTSDAGTTTHRKCRECAEARGLVVAATTPSES